MVDRPILFSGAMVPPVRDGRKTQTRRIVKGMALDWLDHFDPGFVASPENGLCPYGYPGDRLWVRETWAPVPASAYRCSEGVQQIVNPADPDMAAVYAAGWDRSRPGRWRPSIHMPRWASRITLEITGVRCERLWDIGEDDAKAEGITALEADTNGCDGYRDAFRLLWASINSAESWAADPWVWVVEFKRAEAAHG